MKLVLIGLLFPLCSFASRWNYEDSWKAGMQTHFDSIDQKIKTEPVSNQPQCQSIYKSIVDKGSLNVAYALGYFDESEINNKTTSPELLSTSIDKSAFTVIYDFLTKPCLSANSYNLCGFSEDSKVNESAVVLSKKINMFGRDVLMKISLTAASASESFLSNTNELSSEQNFLIEQSKANFFGNIGKQSVDVVFYNGHSRDGGGPDFAPPVLRKSNLHPDYGYYQSKRFGINAILKSMQNSQNKNQIMGLFSCSSRQHFSKSILKLNPTQKMIVADLANDYLTATLSSMGYLEAITQGSCGKSMGAMANKLSPFYKTGFSQIGL